jgi:hypothetical protein
MHSQAEITTALIFFGLPLLELAGLAKALFLSRATVAKASLFLAIISALLGTVGMISTSAPPSCVQEWVGLAISLLTVCLSLTQVRGGAWRIIVLLVLDVYLSVAWGLLVTGCNQQKDHRSATLALKGYKPS